MKLLVDENLPRSVVSRRISRQFPDSAHVVDLGLERTSDLEIWKFARTNGFAILSKDGDFRNLCFLHGAPPKVIWLRTGNASVAVLGSRLEQSLGRIAGFLAEHETALLTID